MYIAFNCPVSLISFHMDWLLASVFHDTDMLREYRRAVVEESLSLGLSDVSA